MPDKMLREKLKAGDEKIKAVIDAANALRTVWIGRANRCHKGDEPRPDTAQTIEGESEGFDRYPNAPWIAGIGLPEEPSLPVRAGIHSVGIAALCATFGDMH